MKGIKLWFYFRTCWRWLQEILWWKITYSGNAYVDAYAIRNGISSLSFIKVLSFSLYSVVDSIHGGSGHEGLLPLERQDQQLFASEGAIRFPIEPLTEAWTEKVFRWNNWGYDNNFGSEVIPTEFLFAFICRLNDFIYCLPQKNLPWMYHLTWKQEGVFLSSQIPCLWTCLQLLKFGICFHSRKILVS